MLPTAVAPYVAGLLTAPLVRTVIKHPYWAGIVTAPLVAMIIKPLVRGTVKGAVALGLKTKKLAAQAREEFHDLPAEASAVEAVVTKPEAVAVETSATQADVAKPEAVDTDEAVEASADEADEASADEADEASAVEADVAKPEAVAVEVVEPDGNIEDASDLEDIKGIGVVYARRLRAAGVSSIEALLKTGGSPAGRTELAKRTGISHDLIQRWVNQATS